MKYRKILILATFFILFSLSISSCGPTIHYLGESYDSSQSVEVYYEAKQIKKEYKVIGRMTNDKIFEYDTEVIRKKMIEKAKQVGADGIIFSDLSVEKDNKQDDRIAVKAELIKFL